MAARTRLRAVLSHIRPSTAAHPAAAISTEQDAEFPVGFSSHGPDKDVDPAAARKIGMSPAETAFFQEFGYIVKRGLVPTAELAPWVDRLWEKVVPLCCNRSDPSVSTRNLPFLVISFFISFSSHFLTDCLQLQTFVDTQLHPDWGPSAEFAAEARAVGRGQITSNQRKSAIALYF